MLEQLQTISMTFLRGRFTYVVSFLTVVYGLAGFLTGMLTPEQAVISIQIGLVGFGLRRSFSEEATLRNGI